MDEVRAKYIVEQRQLLNKAGHLFKKERFSINKGAGNINAYCPS